MIWLLVILILVACWVEHDTLKHSIDHVVYHMEIERKSVEPGEAFGLVSSVENQKRKMIPYLKMKESVPAELELAEEDKSGVLQYSSLVSEFYLGGWQRMSFRRSVKLSKRGCYHFTCTGIETGDFLGLSTKMSEYSNHKQIIVKPHPISDQALELAVGGFLGDVAVRRFWMEDPMYLSGYQAYTGREPLKDISWTMSAKKNQLLVKEYDHTAEPTCTLVVDIMHGDYTTETEQAIEVCYSMARSICEMLEARGFAYGFQMNAARSVFGGIGEEIYPGRGSVHLNSILETLGMATHQPAGSLDQLLQRMIARGTPGSACIVISLEGLQRGDRRIERLREVTGFDVLVLEPECVPCPCQT